MLVHARAGRLWPLAACLAIAVASPVGAAGVNLFWDDCSPAGTYNRSFACDTNAGSHKLVASYDPPDGLTMVNGNNLVIDLQSASDPLPLWWEFRNPGTCRTTSLYAHHVFDPFTCEDPWLGQGISGITAYLTLDSNQRRIGASVSVPGSMAGPQQAGTEYYSLNIVINDLRTVGEGACAGCEEPVCIILNSILITQPVGTPGGSPQISNPLVSNFVTWQGGIVLNSYGCPGGSRVLNRTWGRLKGIYR